MGRLPTNNRKYEIEQAWDIHQEIARRILLGQKNVVIAEELKVTPEMVSYTRNSTVIKRQLSALQEAANINAVDVRKRITDMAPKAAAKLEEILDNPTADNSLQAKVATTVLEMDGHKAPTRIEGAVLHGHLTFEEIKALKERAIEQARLNGSLAVDITHEEVTDDDSQNGAPTPDNT